ncbi:Transglycosylase associated protein [Actinomyces bovis]|uniref:Transglycosylase associated protein n=1 Tax=Actinomyces bovis TaxID=1658 RepID=A0ABY1VPZ9_9ACTO|nr:GlsB/YeaQ/YmgE family stress response membrane protein [Actinomyces bovis]SPT54191.1 Transglycosylase associated protein [Actinomyces bovis]VEG56573.1 Transglycosylase associated protein [Actinomyces israelii]
MGFFAYIILGLVVGAIAKKIMPGIVGEGWGSSLVIGVLGAMVGGWLGNLVFHVGLGSFWNLKTWVLSIVGALIVMYVWNKIRSKN